MPRLKIIIIGAIALILLAVGLTIQIQHKAIVRLKTEQLRLAGNNNQLLAENLQIMTLRIKEKEVTGKLRIERDSLAASLKIKPKQIEKIITIDNSTHDTVRIEIPVTVLSKNHWSIADTGKCYIWQGEVFYINDSLNVYKTAFIYINKTTQTFYKKRPHKLLFIRYGKWQYLQKINAKCGEVTYKAFVFER